MIYVVRALIATVEKTAKTMKQVGQQRDENTKKEPKGILEIKSSVTSKECLDGLINSLYTAEGKKMSLKQCQQKILNLQ